MSMTADVCDMDELASGKRREGIFGAIYWWMVKFGFAIAGLLTGIIMSLVGFNTGAETQTESAITGLRLFFSGIPIAGTLIAMWVMWNYDLTEAKARDIKKQLDERKKPAAKPSSAYIPGKLISLRKSGGALNTISGINFSNRSEADIKLQFAENLNNGVHGLCFSPYAEGQETGDIISAAQIRKRLDVIAPHTKWVRSFSCTEGNELIPAIAQEKGLKTRVGVWISNDRARNEKEINMLLSLAQAGLVDMAAIGNEVLHRGEISEQELLVYIHKVRKALPASIPVGYVDAYYQYLKRPALVDACDVILTNCYPFWEGANNQYSISYINNMLEMTQNIARGKKVIVTETGWPTTGQKVEDAEPSKLNAMKYFIAVQEWAKNNNIELFYFSSFDESWKVKEEGAVGARWGIWDKDDKLKY
jgi:GPH family glycoside/pentoside/hexuronide:cation symporter